jgi:hypothetical protein
VPGGGVSAGFASNQSTFGNISRPAVAANASRNNNATSTTSAQVPGVIASTRFGSSNQTNATDQHQVLVRGNCSKGQLAVGASCFAKGAANAAGGLPQYCLWQKDTDSQHMCLWGAIAAACSSLFLLWF